jgi:hypothetical protein
VRKSWSYAQLADQRGQGLVVGVAAGLHPQDRDAFAGGARPIGVQRSECLVQEGEPDQIALVGGQFAEVVHERGGAAVRREHVHAAVKDHRGDVGHGVE